MALLVAATMLFSGMMPMTAKAAQGILEAGTTLSSEMPSAQNTETGLKEGNSVYTNMGLIDGWDSTDNTYDYIWFGEWPVDGVDTPLKWKVLDDQTNTGETGYYLLHDYAIASIFFEKTPDKIGEGTSLGSGFWSELIFGGNLSFNNAINTYEEYGHSTLWRESDARKWCSDFAGKTQRTYTFAEVPSAFSEAEQAVILPTSKTDNAYMGTYYHIFENGEIIVQNDRFFAGYSKILEEDKVFLPSAEEMQNASYGFDKEHIWNLEESGTYWLRSYPYEDDIKLKAGVMQGASVEIINAFSDVFSGALSGATQDYANASGARPAFNLSPDAALFTMAADNSGQQKFGVAKAYAGREWKLTLKDSNSFADASINKTTVSAGETVTVTHKALSSFSDAEYTNVTAALVDANGNVAVYGSINNNVDATSTTFTIPMDCEDGAYTLMIMGEDWNGACHTNYATGTPYTVNIEVKTSHSHKVCCETNCSEHKELTSGQAIFTKAELQAINEAGFYHLVRDIDLGGDSWSPVDGVILCLNGYEIRGVGDATIQVPEGVKFTITDCKDDGQVSSQNGSGIACVNGGECHIYGGILGGNYGVHLSGGSKAYLYVAPSMEGGTADFYVDSTSRLCVAKTLEDKPKSVYTVHMDVAGVFTSGWATHMASATVGDYFSLVDTHLAVLETDSSGELCLIGMTQHYICGASCEHGDASHIMDTDTQWKVFDGLVTSLTDGFYYLTSDITLSGAISISGDVLLCLNGKTLTQTTANDAIRIGSGSHLTLCDCAVGQTGTIAGGNVEKEDKCGVNVDGGTFTMYGGTITGFTKTSVNTNPGAGVRVSHGTFNMYGGTISGNMTKCSEYQYNGVYYSKCHGGGVGVYGGTFNMYGGTISGNTAQYIGTPSTGDSRGGGVYVVNESQTRAEFNMYGGTISGNKADQYGGGVWIESGFFAMSDGAEANIINNTIKNGSSSNLEKTENAFGFKAFPAGTIKAQGYTGVYDGQSHSITLTYSDGATATYAADHPGITYETTNPSFKDVGTHIIYYKVSQTDYLTVSGSAQVIITPGTLTAASGVVTASGTYGATLSELTVTGPDVTCGGQKVDGHWTLTGDTVPVVNDIGSYTATFVPTDGASNYYPLTQEVVLQISPVELTVTAENKSKEYGEADPALTWSITSGTTIGNETLTGISVSRAKGEKGGTYAITVTQLPGANPNYDITFVNGTLTIIQAIPTLNAPEAKNSIIYGAKLSTVGLTEGWIWEDGDTVPNVINNGYMAYYTPTSTDIDNYNWAAIDGWKEEKGRVERTVSVTVKKAIPEYTIPTDLTATYGQTLAEVILPMGWTWEDATTSVGDVGTKTFAAVYNHDNTDNYSVVEMDLSVTVTEAASDYNAPTANTLTYTGVDQSLITAGSAEGGTMEYALGTDDATAPVNGWNTVIPTGKDAGVYYVWYRVVGDSNHSDVAAKCIAVTINKAALTVEANDNTITYGNAPAGNGVTYDGFVNNEVEDVLGGTLAYEYNYAQYDNVGNTYEIMPKGLTSNNYEITYVKGTLTVEKKEIGISWSNTELIYNGQAQKPTATATGVVNSDLLELVVEGAVTDASETDYTATVTKIDGTKAGNYKLPDAKTSQFTIGQKELTIVWGNSTFTYDGADKFPAYEVQGMVAGDVVTMVEEGAQTNASATAYTATITGMTGADVANYKLPANVTREFTIGQATPDLGTVAVSGVVKDTTAPADVVLTQTGNVAGSLVITDSAMLADKNEYTYTFTPEDANYKEITGQVQIDVLDTVVPEIIVEVDELEWKEFLNNITFGLFFKNTQQVTITSADNEHGSGLKDTLYHISDKELSAEELGQVEWIVYTEAFDIDPDAKVVIYAKASDNDGNSATISSEGMILDQTAPVAGITHNGIYYGDITFAVSDELAGLKEVKVDDAEVTLVEGTYTIAADDKEHTIVVSDQAGNVIEYIITVYKKEVTNVGDGKLTETTEVLMDKIPFTEEEQQAIDQGADVVIRLEIQDATANVPAEDKDLIAAKAGEDKVGMYLDITMYKQVGNAAAEKLTILEEEVEVIFQLPESLINTDETVIRTYHIIRVHEGVAKLIAPVWNAEAKTLRFKTDRFSTYAVIYSDMTVTPSAPVTPPGGGAPGESDPGPAPSDGTNSGSTAPEQAPMTGDNSHLGLWIAMALASCGALVMIDRKKRYHMN